jgi:hypothetical protein
VKYNIIQTENYLLIVDDLEIKVGDWFYNNVLMKCLKVIGVWGDKVDSLNSNLETFKVITHLPLNNSPVLEGVDLLPPLEDDVEKLVYNIYKQSFDEFGEPEWDEGKLYHRQKGFVEGYNKAKEKYKYTEEDLREALFEVLNTSKEECCATHTKDSIVRRVIKSLQQPKTPVAFECHSTREFRIIDLSHQVYYEKVGQTVWVGKYIFND